MSDYTSEQVNDLIGAIKKLAETREQSQPEAKAADGGRYANALDGSKEIADKLAAHDEEKLKAQIAEQVKAQLMATRAPSRAAEFGQGGSIDERTSRRNPDSVIPPFPSLKAAFRDYRSGEFLEGLVNFKSLSDGIDVERAAWGKAKLADLGVVYAGVPEMSHSYTFVTGDGKATLGNTNSTGGYVLPNNLVDTLVKPATQRAVLQNLVTIISGVAVRGVDQPYRMGAPARMTFQDWGTTKENVDETYGSYTATLGTLARVYDISKQYARFSAGAAEQDVMDELTKAAILAENYEMIAGAGTGTVGSGDPVTGVYTSLNATPTFLAYKGAFSSASDSTVAGSFAAACSNLMGSLAGRNREATAILVDSTTFFTAISQGSDNAGFWVNPAGGPTGFTRTESGGLAFWGVPIYYDTNLGTNAATKIAIAAEWKAFKLYRGMEFRIDSSDVAGDRWDKNLIGFRGEEEIGFNADTAVHVGAAQLLTAVIP